MRPADGIQVGHLFHMAVARFDAGEVGLPDHPGVALFLEFRGEKGQGGGEQTVAQLQGAVHVQKVELFVAENVEKKRFHCASFV